MAESVLFGIVQSLLSKLASFAVEEDSLGFGVKQDLQGIINTVSYINAVLLDAEQKQHQNNELGEWLRQIKCILSDAEDVIDDFECEALRKQVVDTSGSIIRKVCYFFSSSNPLVYCVIMAHRIKHIKERFNKAAEIRDRFGLQIIDTRVVQNQETHSVVNDSDVIGRVHDKQKIVELLSDNSRSLSVITIVGIGGMGKTTLAKAVFNDKIVVGSFQLKMWISVSNDFELKNLLVKIIESAPDQSRQENIRNFGMEQLQNQLRNIIAGQKFLLVLDDVWNEDRVKWEELRGLIQAGAQGSKILVTSRSDTVATMMDTYSSYHLKRLSKEDSLSVFVKWAFREGEESKYPELMEIGKDIVLKCGGLPLALKTLGNSLFLKFDIKEWMIVKDNVIKLSYDQLPSYLKRCFACFSLFEKGFQFNSFHTIVLWEALGFLPSSHRGENLKDIGNKFLLELRSRSLLQDFIDYGSACKFKLQGLVHDSALRVLRDEFQLLNSHSENALHLSCNENSMSEQTPLPAGLRTITFPHGVRNGAFLNSLVSRCKRLRVLQIINSGYASLPHSIGKLKHLRYLNLEDNKELKSLPDSVCELQNLINLNLSGCIELQELPNGIGNLISLQQLQITTKQSKLPDKEIEKLTSLEILSLFSCGNLESLFEGIELPSLKFLDINSCGSLRFVPLYVIPNLENLSIDGCYRLNLSMDHDNQIPRFRLKLLYLESLPQLMVFPEWLRGCTIALQSLVIVDCVNLEDLPNWLSTMISLKTLTIENCPELPLLPLGVHHQHPNLEYLKIEGCPKLSRRCQENVGRYWSKISRQVINGSPELEN